MHITSFVTKKRDRALLVGDYNSYRSQLSRQLLSLRRKLGRTTPNKAKYAAKPQITAQDVASNPEFVHYLLMEAERAWAHAMHIKSTHADDSTSKGISGPTRKHIISKLHKASVYASHLVALLGDRSTSGATDTDFLEAQAYSLCLSGSEEFEKQASKRFDEADAQKQAWKNCLVSYSEAHVIYTALLFSTKRDVFKDVLAATVDPSIRYAAYQSRISRTIPIPTVAKQHFRRDQPELLALVQKLNPSALSQETTQIATAKDGTSTLDIPTTITWRERTAPIADAAIGQAIAATLIASSNLAALFASAAKGSKSRAKARSKADNSPKALAAAYDQVLTGAQDTVDAVRRAISDLQKEGVSESDQRMQDLRVSDLATNYTLISWRIGRNRVAISGSTGDDGTSFDQDAPIGRRSARAQLKRDAKRAASKSNASGDNDDEIEAMDEGGEAPLHPASERRHHTLKRPALLSQLRERAVLYDATLQSLDSIHALRGATSSPDFLAEVAQKRAYFQALKCLNIGRSHNVLGSSNAKQALALFARAAAVLDDAFPDLARSAADAHPSTASTTPPQLSIAPAQLSALHRSLAHATLRQRGLVALYQYTAHAASSSTSAPANNAATPAPTDPPLIANLHAYPAHGVDLRNIVTYPPRLQPVPVKPIFLDLAWNYIEYPGRQTARSGGGGGGGGAPVGVAAADVDMANAQGDTEDAQQREREEKEREEQQQAPAKKRGWFGFGR